MVRGEFDFMVIDRSIPTIGRVNAYEKKKTIQRYIKERVVLTGRPSSGINKLTSSSETVELHPTKIKHQQIRPKM